MNNAGPPDSEAQSGIGVEIAADACLVRFLGMTPVGNAELRMFFSAAALFEQSCVVGLVVR